mgnify:CR=1 FL=1
MKKGVKHSERPVTTAQPTPLDMSGAAKRTAATSAAVPSGEFAFDGVIIAFDGVIIAFLLFT